MTEGEPFTKDEMEELLVTAITDPEKQLVDSEELCTLLAEY